jgi:hypothetical protein
MSGCFYWAVEIEPGRAMPGHTIGIEAHSQTNDPNEARKDAIRKIEAKGQPTAPWHSAECVYIGWAPREYGDWECKDGSWRRKA